MQRMTPRARPHLASSNAGARKEATCAEGKFWRINIVSESPKVATAGLNRSDMAAAVFELFDFISSLLNLPYCKLWSKHIWHSAPNKHLFNVLCTADCWKAGNINDSSVTFLSVSVYILFDTVCRQDRSDRFQLFDFYHEPRPIWFGLKAPEKKSEILQIINFIYLFVIIYHLSRSFWVAAFKIP